MNLKRRKIVDRFARIAIITFSILTIVPLVLILLYLLKTGISAINLDLLTRVTRPVGERGGVLNSIVGTILITMISTLIATPLGILTGVLIAEYPENLLSKILNYTVRMISGIPSIIIGVVIYLWLVKPLRSYSALSGSVALAIMIIPNIVSNTTEVLKMIPLELREASLALGASFSKTLFKVLLPIATPGILAGILAGLARISGETAPLLFTAFGNPYLNFNIMKPMNTLSLTIYNYALSPYAQWHRITWGASILLIFMVFTFNILAKWSAKRWTK
ncbi:MAG: phosphate ABC transporter permease PstA [candidate division WOR-3 bacterium]